MQFSYMYIPNRKCIRKPSGIASHAIHNQESRSRGPSRPGTCQKLARSAVTLEPVSIDLVYIMYASQKLKLFTYLVDPLSTV